VVRDCGYANGKTDAVMNGHAIASHYCFNAQRENGKGLAWTDVLARYKAYAEENVFRH